MMYLGFHSLVYWLHTPVSDRHIHLLEYIGMLSLWGYWDCSGSYYCSDLGYVHGIIHNLF